MDVKLFMQRYFHPHARIVYLHQTKCVFSVRKSNHSMYLLRLYSRRLRTEIIFNQTRYGHDVFAIKIYVELGRYPPSART